MTRQLFCHPCCRYFLDLLICRHLAAHDTCEVIQVILKYLFAFTFQWTACSYIITNWERECLRCDSIRISGLAIVVLWCHVSSCRKIALLEKCCSCLPRHTWIPSYYGLSPWRITYCFRHQNMYKTKNKLHLHSIWIEQYFNNFICT